MIFVELFVLFYVIECARNCCKLGFVWC